MPTAPQFVSHNLPRNTTWAPTQTAYNPPQIVTDQPDKPRPVTSSYASPPMRAIGQQRSPQPQQFSSPVRVPGGQASRTGVRTVPPGGTQSAPQPRPAQLPSRATSW